jgi:hypothetical protein
VLRKGTTSNAEVFFVEKATATCPFAKCPKITLKTKLDSRPDATRGIHAFLTDELINLTNHETSR